MQFDAPNVAALWSRCTIRTSKLRLCFNLFLFWWLIFPATDFKIFIWLTYTRKLSLDTIATCSVIFEFSTTSRSRTRCSYFQCSVNINRHTQKQRVLFFKIIAVQIKTISSFTETSARKAACPKLWNKIKWGDEQLPPAARLNVVNGPRHRGPRTPSSALEHSCKQVLSQEWPF